MRITIWERLKSPVVITAFAALVLFVLKTWGLLGFIGLTEDSFNEGIALIIATITAYSTLNDPTNPSGF